MGQREIRRGTARAAGAALLATMLLTTAAQLAIGSAGAAELPEFGQCVRIGVGRVTRTARFKNTLCTKLSAGEDSGAYEFEAMPAGKHDLWEEGADTSFGVKGSGHWLAVRRRSNAASSRPKASTQARRACS